MTDKDLFDKMYAINIFTGSKIAPWWKIVVARVFGTKHVAWMDGIRYTYHRWRGTEYCTDMRPE